MIQKLTSLLLFLAFFSMQVFGQQSSFSLKEAVTYAIQNNESIKNALLDVQGAEFKVKETYTLGFPQINSTIQVAHSPKIQGFVLEYDPNSAFTGSAQGLKKGDPIKLSLGLQNSAQAGITWNQLIFDGSYLVGLQAASTYKQLSSRNLLANKVTVATNVTKAYYSALINTNRLGLLDGSIGRLDSTLREAKALLKNGFVEQLDVNRLEVSVNNLKVERQKTERLVELSVNLLKFQMGYDISQPIMLTDKINVNSIEALKADVGNADKNAFENRSEYRLLQTQKALDDLSLKNVKAGYVPKVYGSFSAGSLTAASKFGNLTEFNTRWSDYSQIGVQVQIPIFDSFQKYWQMQQKKVAIEKTKNTLDQFKRSVSLQTASASVSLENALATFETQKRTLALSEEVVRVTKAKFKAGLGSNLEVVSAEADLKDALVNYYNAALDAINAKVDMDVATGKLYNE